MGSTGPPGANGYCDQGESFTGRPNQVCGGGWDGAGKCEGQVLQSSFGAI